MSLGSGFDADERPGIIQLLGLGEGNGTQSPLNEQGVHIDADALVIQGEPGRARILQLAGCHALVECLCITLDQLLQENGPTFL